MGKKLRHFTRGIGITNKHVKKHFTSLVIREMQFKATMRYNFTHIRRAKKKKKEQTHTHKEEQLKPLLWFCYLMADGSTRALGTVWPFLIILLLLGITQEK